ncbi:hypothetical protein Tco_0917562 [Tanacetum coccineum]
MNGWIKEEEEEEDPKIEEEEDPKMEEEEEEMGVDANEEWDGPEWILPYQGADPLNPPPPAFDSESEIEFEEAAPMPPPPIPADHEPEPEAAPMPPSPILADHEPEAKAATVGTGCKIFPEESIVSGQQETRTGRLELLTRLFTNTQVWTGSSSSSAVDGHGPEDLTLSHIRSDLDVLHRRVRQIKEDDVRVENNRLRMMLDCSENRTRAAWRELDRATWHYHNLRGWSIEVHKHLPQHLHYQEAPYVLPSSLMVPVTHDDPRDPYVAVRDAATAPATDNDDPATREETSPSKQQGSPPRDS